MSSRGRAAPHELILELPLALARLFSTQMRYLPSKFRQHGEGMFVLGRQGAIGFELSPASAGSTHQPGVPRSYDWANKLVYFASPLEMVQISAMNVNQEVSHVLSPRPGLRSRGSAIGWHRYVARCLCTHSRAVTDSLTCPQFRLQQRVGGASAAPGLRSLVIKPASGQQGRYTFTVAHSSEGGSGSRKEATVELTFPELLVMRVRDEAARRASGT
jgi:hypothetical protein